MLVFSLLSNELCAHLIYFVHEFVRTLTQLSYEISKNLPDAQYPYDPAGFCFHAIN